MATLEKLHFSALLVDGSNYLTWSVDAETYFASLELEDTLITDNNLTLQQKAKAVFLLRQHLAPSLKTQYMNEVNPRLLWDKLKARFDHMREVWLPEARRDWYNLRVMDHTSIASYNSALFRITSQLEMCGHPVPDADKIDKTLSTFPEANIALGTQYRNMRFTVYFDLIAHLLVEEKQQIVALQNARKRPAGSAPPPQKPETNYSIRNQRGRGRSRGRGGYQGRNQNLRGRGNRYLNSIHSRGTSGRGSKRDPPSDNIREDRMCYRCGKIGHIKKDCWASDQAAKRHTEARAKSKQNPEGNYMEMEEDLANYQDPEEPPIEQSEE
jgi:gag-polypeptide of LTR copia-type/Zinc knuckle